MTQTLSIVMLVHDRPRLTRQALQSLADNTRGRHNVVIVDDGSAGETQNICIWFAQNYRWDYIKNAAPLGPGPARNQGIQAHAPRFNRGLIYSSDSDAFFMPGWDETLLRCWNAPERLRERFEVLGGYVHPHNRHGRLISNPDAMAGHSIAELEALGLFSWLMLWETWQKHGPFEPSSTVNGSEDWSFCQRVRKAGGRVGVVVPHVVVNCGVTSSDGRPCPGAALLYDQSIPEGVMIE